jgi:deazaflavin-dependent oxidoreductase (nitroreductase family)
MGLMQRLGKTKMFATINKRLAPRVDLFVHRVTKGKGLVSNRLLPALVLVHMGRKSGRELKSPLAYVPVGDAFAIVGSNFGQDHHPAWTHNLLANPDAFVETAGQRIAVRARLVDADEKAQLWPRFLEMWPAYDTYVERSGRNLRVFVLDRVATT